jgi:hypothetical protein
VSRPYTINPRKLRGRQRKNSASSPWRLGPCLNTARARETWAAIRANQEKETTE